MAPWLNFLIPFASAVVGMALWVSIREWWGLGVFFMCFLVGSLVGTRVLKRYASKEQIREDLKARLKND